MKTRIFTLFVLTITLVSCNSYFHDMDIKNEYDPDIATVMGDINQYPSLIGGAYSNWWHRMLTVGEGDTWSLNVNADACTAGAGNWGLQSYLYYEDYEKPEIDNNDQNNGFPKNFWYNQYGMINTVRNMLAMIKSKSMIYKENGEDVTYKVLANCYFLMGAYYTENALLFDKCFLLTEDTDVSTITGADLAEASKAQELALSYLDKCISICKAQSFDNFDGLLPNDVVSNSAKLKNLANFIAARAIAYFPRDNKTAVDWSKVLTYINDGLTEDIKATLPSAGWDEWSLAEAAWPSGNQWLRVNMRVINMMSNNDPKAPWPIPSSFTTASVLSEVTNCPDVRLGTDFIYYPSADTPTGGLSYGGYTKYSSYALKRFTDPGGPEGTGDLYMFMKAESDLLEAEALLNTNGSKSTIATLINNTRKTRGHLTDITSSSTTAAMLEAIYYERFVECGYAYAATPFYDRRRTPIDKFQLATRSFRQLPVPLMELSFYKLDSYTFGGATDSNDKYKF